MFLYLLTQFSLFLWLRLCTKTVLNTSKNFKNYSNTLCDTETKPQDSGIENYAYGYHSPLTVIDGCLFGSSHWHLIFEDTGPEDNTVFSPYAPATILCLVTCFKILILPTEKNIFTHGAIVSRLHVAVEYLSKYNHVSTNKTKKQLPLPNPVKRLSTISTTTSNKSASTIPDVTVKRLCQLMLGEHSSSLYQIMDILLRSFVRETSDYLINFQFRKNSSVKFS